METLKYPNPWDFPEKTFNNTKKENQAHVKYRMLGEIAMGAPLGGMCMFVDSENIEILVEKWCGGNPIWNNDGTMFAIPLWEKKFLRGTIQKIGIFDLEKKTLTKYKKRFRVIHFESFSEKEIKFIDSPIYKTKSHNFNIENEKIETVKQF